MFCSNYKNPFLKHAGAKIYDISYIYLPYSCHPGLRLISYLPMRSQPVTLLAFRGDKDRQHITERAFVLHKR